MESKCPDCGGPKYKYAVYCNGCKSKGSRNGRYGKPVSQGTREKISRKALEREYHPCKKRNPTSVQGGRQFAVRWFPLPALCERCKKHPPRDRHHIDGNTQNNTPDNIAFLCRRCHQKTDGRHEFIKNVMPAMGGKACAKRES